MDIRDCLEANHENSSMGLAPMELPKEVQIELCQTAQVFEKGFFGKTFDIVAYFTGKDGRRYLFFTTICHASSPCESLTYFINYVKNRPWCGIVKTFQSKLMRYEVHAFKNHFECDDVVVSAWIR